MASVLVNNPTLSVANLTQQQVQVANPMLRQPGVATPTVYSLATTQSTAGIQQYTATQIAVASQLGQVRESCI